MAKVSSVFCIYNKSNILVAVGVNEPDVWNQTIKALGTKDLDPITNYFNLIKAGYYLEVGSVAGK
jgi:hypothetical protein